MRKIVLGIVVTGLIASFAAPASAQDESPITVSFGTDVPNDYYFRGLATETTGFITQPFLSVSFAASETVTIDVGTWNSLHSASTTRTFFESNLFGTVGFEAGDWSPAVTYTWYFSPNDSFGHVHEAAFSLSHNSLLAPSILIATELRNDNTDNSGNTYLELGVEPGIPYSGPVSFSVPVSTGLGLKDYFGEGFAFGFFRAGVNAGIDLGNGIEVHGGVAALVLGDNLQFDDNRVKPVFTVGFSVTR